MSGVHARLSPSSADRWSTCTASVALIDEMRLSGDISDDGSVFAAEGTVAHEVREMSLNFGLDPHHFIGMVMTVDGFTFTVDDDMAFHLWKGIDWVREHTGRPDVEIRVDLSPWLPGNFGTCDTGWIELVTLPSGEPSRQLVISDLKYGAGEPVDAKGNKQLRLYALGYLHYRGRPAVDSVLMNIDQPRAGGMKFEEISIAELLAFGEEMKAVYAKIVAGDVEFKPGQKSCRWCPVKNLPQGCAARNKWLDEMAEAHTNPAGLTPERRYYLVQHAPDIRAWLAKLHEDSLLAAMNGNPDPGSKAVEGDLGDRYFTDAKKAEELLTAALGDEAYKPRTLIGITDIEKKVKPGKRKAGFPETWESLLKLVDRAPGKPKLVSIDHAKPALVRWEDDFDDLN